MWPIEAGNRISISSIGFMPLVETAAWILGKNCRATPGAARKHARGSLGASRRLVQNIAFRYRAASLRNIGRNPPKSMQGGVPDAQMLTVWRKTGIWPGGGLRL